MSSVELEYSTKLLFLLERYDQNQGFINGMTQIPAKCDNILTHSDND